MNGAAAALGGVDGHAAARRCATGVVGGLAERPGSDAAGHLGELVAAHAFGWLVAGSAVGLLLATLLLAPGLGDWLAPLGYGRWMPLHLDLLLYGWTALPFVGALLRGYGVAGGGARVALAAWSAALAAGAASWLAGATSGKVFVEWRGGARLALVAALLTLAGVLAGGWWRRWRRLAAGTSTQPRPGDARSRPATGAALAAHAARGLLLLALLAVPVALWATTDPGRYPPVDPASGGPTGTSLLGSTVGLLAALLAAPWLLGVAARDPRRARRVTVQTVAALAACAAAFLLLPHGDRSNREPAQVAALVALVAWLPLLPRYGRLFAWPAAARRWLAAFSAWGTLLLLSAVATFLPAALDRWKFTNALVAHAHLAMAGLTSAVAALLLVCLGGGGRVPAALAARWPFWAWNGGTAAMVGALGWLGTLEAADPGLLFRPGEAAVTVAYGARWLAGAAMLAAALAWLVRAWPQGETP